MNKYLPIILICVGLISRVHAQNTELIYAEILPNTINKPDSDELAPVVSADGKTMYFVRGYNETDILKKNRVGQEIFYSTFENGSWTEAKRVEGKLNNTSHNVVCGISADGKKLYLSNTYITNRGKMHRGISYSEKDSDGWGKPKELTIEGFDDISINLNSHFHFFITGDEKYIIMSKHTESGEGGEEDLYYSEKSADKSGRPIYSAPNPLKSKEGEYKAINTEGFETSPFLSADGLTLFFSSNRQTADVHNYKYSHIYFTTRQKMDDWENWEAPQPIEKYDQEKWAVVNKADFDAYLFPHTDSDRLMDNCYFSSVRDGGVGAADIWKLNVGYQLQLTAFACDDKGNKTDKKIPIDIVIEKLNGKPNDTNDTWTYDFFKADFGSYKITAKAKGTSEYYDYSSEMQISANDFKTGNRLVAKKDICLKPKPPVTKLDSTLATVYFEFDKASMDSTVLYRKIKDGEEELKDAQVFVRRSEGKKVIEELVSKIKNIDGEFYKIVLIGRADSVGRPEKNQVLSQRRIDSVKVFLENELKKAGLNINVSKEETPLGESNHLLDKNGKLSNEARRLNRSVRIEGYIRKVLINNP